MRWQGLGPWSRGDRVVRTPVTSQAAQLAHLLVEHVRAQGIVDPDLLTRNPLEALDDDPSVKVTWVAADTLPPGCSIAATYIRATVPAQIAVAEDAAPGRRRFSLLHEYGHHLRNQVIPVIEALWKARTLSAQLEEKVCDAFASFVLIPTSVRREAFAEGVTAASVLDLMARSSASEQAVAVAAAEEMPLPGYVMLLTPDGEVDFAARSDDVFPVRRGTVQGGFLARAAGGVARQGVAEIDLGGGVMTPELNVDAASRGGRVVAVAVDGPAPWQKFSAGRTLYAKPLDGWCDECSQSFTTYNTCAYCGEPKCPACGRCGCEVRPVTGERVCTSCFILQPPAAYPSPTATECNDCC